ncbi:MAG TPA: pyridoxine 5'-phosphate synthase [Bacteroidota bacterium]|nr:pyridoxine 5'-phosphate synthase [Bacteroidota bacterium]
MRLSINIDHIATLRNARGGTIPDPVDAAQVAEDAGADGIVCHLREDRRHIRDNDVVRLRKSITSKLDLEMAATPEIISIALKIKPDLVTLVPEKRQELTTEGGLDIVRLRRPLQIAIKRFHDKGIAVSLFVDPNKDQIDVSKEIGSDMIELHTGEYADGKSPAERNRHLQRIKKMSRYGHSLGLIVNAGHGLDYDNIKPIVKIREIEEVSIGHAVIVRAVSVGLECAVREMVRLIKR